jgi:hypothetical protein
LQRGLTRSIIGFLVGYDFPVLILSKTPLMTIDAWSLDANLTSDGPASQVPLYASVVRYETAASGSLLHPRTFASEFVGKSSRSSSQPCAQKCSPSQTLSQHFLVLASLSEARYVVNTCILLAIRLWRWMTEHLVPENQLVYTNFRQSSNVRLYTGRNIKLKTSALHFHVLVI